MDFFKKDKRVLMFILDPSQVVRLLGKQYFFYSKSESQYKLFDQSVIVDEKNEISIYSWINAFVAKTYAQLAEKQISLCKVGTLLLGLSIKRVLLYCSNITSYTNCGL